MLKITYTPWVKNAARGSTNYYVRVREGSKITDIPLHTPDRAVAEQWCSLRRQELELYNNYVAMGEEPPIDVRGKVYHLTTAKQEKAVSLTTRQVVEEYCKHCAQRGLRDNTCDDYYRVLSLLFRAQWNQPMPKPCRELIETILDRFASRSLQTRRTYGKALRSYLKWYCKSRGLSTDVLDSIPTVKLERKSHDIWSMEEMTRICDAAPDPVTRAYFHVLRTTGARNTEVSMCKWEDYDGHFLNLKSEYTKGRKSRKLPISAEVSKMIDALPKNKETIFSTLPTTNTGRNNLLHDSCDRAGVKRGSLHKFRHSLATFLFRRGLDIKTVGQLLGHASPSTTLAIYVEAMGAEEVAQKVLEVVV